jgi:tape measure domain-containing protein
MAGNEVKIRISAQDEATPTIKKVEGEVKSFKEKSSEYFKSAADASSKFALGLGGVAAGAGALAMKGVEAASTLENISIGFKTALKSSDAAKDAVDKFRKAGVETPFDTTSLAKVGLGLTTITKDADKSLGFILNVGKAIAATGGGNVELERVGANLQQIGALGKASLADVKQFANAGIPIFKMLGDTTGKTGQDLEKFISEGGVTFDLLQKMFEEAGTGAGDFATAFKDAAGSYTQVLSNFQESIDNALADIVTQTGVFDMVKQAMGAFIQFMTDNKDAIVGGVKAFFEFVRDNGPIIAGIIVGALIPAVTSFVVSLGGILVTLAPFMLLGAAVAALYVAFNTNFLGIRDITNVVISYVTQRFQEIANFWTTVIYPAVIALWTKITEVWNHIMTDTDGVWSAIREYFVTWWRVISEVFTAAFNVLIELWQTFSALFSGDWEGFWTNIKELGGALWELIKVTIIGIWDILVTELKLKWELFKTVFSALWEGVKFLASSAWTAIANVIKSAFDGIVRWLTVDAKNSIESGFSAMMSGLAGIAKSILNSVIATFEGFVNTAVDGINALIDAANAVSPIKVGRVSHVSIGRLFRGGIVGEGLNGGMPLQAFATGGVVNGPAGIDKVPILATAGEIVLNRAQQGRLATQLEGGGGISISLVITGNNFYGDDETFTQRIGNTIIDELKKHIDFESF